MIKDKHIHSGAKTPWKCITLTFGTTANSQTGLLVDSIVPSFPFEIERVEVTALTVTATISCDVQIGPVGGTLATALASAVTPVAATPTAGTLSTSILARRGSATDSVALLYTTNGAGALTNGHVRIWIRPVPLNNEVLWTSA